MPKQSPETPLYSDEQTVAEPTEGGVRRSTRSNKGVSPIRFLAE